MIELVGDTCACVCVDFGFCPWTDVTGARPHEIEIVR